MRLSRTSKEEEPSALISFSPVNFNDWASMAMDAKPFWLRKTQPTLAEARETITTGVIQFVLRKVLIRGQAFEFHHLIPAWMYVMLNYMIRTLIGASASSSVLENFLDD